MGFRRDEFWFSFFFGYWGYFGGSGCWGVGSCRGRCCSGDFDF